MKLIEIRAKALNDLDGKWGMAIATMLLYGAIAGILSAISSFLGAIPIVGWILSIACFICTIPLAYGYLMNMIAIKRAETTSVVDFLKNGIDNFKRSWAVVGHTLLKLLPWIAIYLGCVIAGVIAIFIGSFALASEIYFGGFIAMLVGIIVMIIGVVVFIMKAFLYEMTEYMAIYYPEMTAKEAVEKSAELMKGNRWRFFCLQLCFVGWTWLSLFTFGLLLIFVTPYMAFSNICFFEDLAKVAKKDEVVNQDTPVVEQAQPVASEVVEPVVEATTAEPVINITQE